MKNQPFFTKRHDAFMPNHVSNGVWDPNSMHGRVVPMTAPSGSLRGTLNPCPLS